MAVVVPWEDKSRPFFLRMYESVDGIVLRPSRVMARLAPGKRGSAYWLLSVATFAPIAVVSTVATGERGISNALLATLYIVLAAWVGGLAAAVVARVMGVRTDMGQVGRATAYAWIGAILGGWLLLVTMLLLGVAGFAPGSLPTVGGVAVSFLTTVALISRSMLAFGRGTLKLGVVKALAVAIASITPLWLPIVALAIARTLR